MWFHTAGAGLPLHTTTGGLGHAQLVTGSARVAFSQPAAGFVLLAGAQALIGAGALLVVIHQLRRLLRALGAGSSFAPDNPRRLRVIGAVLAGSAVLNAALGRRSRPTCAAR